MDSASAEIVRAAEERSRALVVKDEEAMDDLLTERFVYTNAAGQLVDKPDYLGFYVRNPSLLWEAQDLDDVDVRAYTNCAVLTARVHDVGSASGERFDRVYRSTFVYVREGNRWRCAAGQTTEAATP
jgi:hypothetical protein